MLVLASAVATPTAVLFGVDTPGWLLSQTCLVLASAAWTWWWVLRPRRRQSAPAAQNIHFLGRMVLAFVLTWINPFFGLYAWVGYLDLGDLRNQWVRRIGLIGVAFTLAGSQSGGFPPTSGVQWLVFVVLLVINIGLAGLLHHLQLQNTRRAEEQRAVIAELGRVNADLERAATENAALHDTVLEQARRAGVQDERQRLAREIHDTIAQSLAATLVQLQAAQHDPDPGVRLARATDLVRSTLREARRSVMNLAPGPLTSTSLAEAVNALVQEWSQERPVQADVTVVGEVRALHPEVEATVLRVAQEALSNVGKHARARRVGVTLTYDDEQVALDVRDDGIGFDPTTSVTDSSFGLRGMRQRAARLAGTLDVETAAEQGTAVSVHLPALSREGAA
ncbi:sensor histidine kinase [Nocardioides sp. AE5]|uniref:sensor histidine kinase n=1 Tax=Nocardioides sp. AE5 TaxID=2962573 RepID=UPI002881FB9A|nr:sensor histidine kinase [Nocardioides sp. AE5]MDT0201734.1 sensor histidine kinase [Nocardioides sp. AE5]